LLKVARLVTPSIQRRWKISTKPRGNVWEIPLPFQASPREAVAVCYYLKEFLDNNRVPMTGSFYTTRIAEVRRYEAAGLEVVEVSTTVALPPWESGVRQEVFIQFLRKASTPSERYTVLLRLVLKTGVRETWIRSTRRFVEEMRSQLILWKGLRRRDKIRYLSMAEGI